MTQYEVLLAIPNKFTPEEVNPIVEEIKTQIVEVTGGKTLEVVNYGKRKLSYPVKHFHHAYYVLVQFDAEKENIKTLNEKLNIQSDLLRHVIVERNDLDPKKFVLTHVNPGEEEVKDEKKDAPRKKPVTSKPAPVKEAKKVETKKAAKKEVVKKVKEEKKEEKKTDEKKDDTVKVADLDKELNKILEDKDIVL